MTDATTVTVKRAESYDPAVLDPAVSELLSADPDLARWLGEADPTRLVVVKPNWIQESHQFQPDVWEPVITHPALLLAIIRRLAELMKGRGTICLCDAPQTYGDFLAITSRGDLRNGIDAIRRSFPSLAVELIDLRCQTWIVKEDVIVERRPNPPDPRGYVKVNLGADSLFSGHPGEGRYYGADYDSSHVNEHHRGSVHEYLLAGSPMQCDLFVNVPKLKAHKKTGLTCALKNLVGINGDKNWLPHFVQGTPLGGGDEFSESSIKRIAERLLKKAGQKLSLAFPGIGTWSYRKMRRIGIQALGDSQTVVRSGNWKGNDTCWRMALDLNRAFLYGSADGQIRETRSPRRYLAIVDGIVGGEGNGPLCPDAVRSNILIAGTNPALVDAAAARLMGFNLGSLPIIMSAFAPHRWPIADMPIDQVRVRDDRIGKNVPLEDLAPAVTGGFRPHFGWLDLNPARSKT